MTKQQCPYCHKLIDSGAYDAHVARHTRRRPDGQQTDYATLPEDERAQGDLDGVPSVYVHGRCGVATRMPEEIIRSYLQNPFLYSANTYCCGCATHVPHRECAWTETGEDLQSYFDGLRAAKTGRKGCLGVLLLLAAAVALLG
jgi:hypothetical protein